MYFTAVKACGYYLATNQSLLDPGDDGMDVAEENMAELRIVILAGRLDSESASQLSTRLADPARADRLPVLIELSRLTYISSAGCRTLFLASRQAAQRGGKLALCGMSGAVERVVDLAGLASRIEIYRTREEALTEMAAA
jgi:anti-anti-sigma factor